MLSIQVMCLDAQKHKKEPKNNSKVANFALVVKVTRSRKKEVNGNIIRQIRKNESFLKGNERES